MRVLGLVVLFVVGWAGGDSAFAEKAKAKESAKVYNRAGEQGQVVIKVKEGQVMRILKQEGRWYKVTLSGRTGWIPRSKVDVMKDDDMARNTRRRPFVDGRSTKRGFGGQGGPDDRVGADATDDKGGGGKKDDTDTTDDTSDDEKPKPAKKPAKRITPDEDEKPKPAKKPPVKKPPVEDDDEKPAKKPAKKDKDEDGDTEGDEPKSAKDADDVADADPRPKAKVKKSMPIYSEPDDESEASFKATTSMTLRLTGKKKGKFVEVENEDADLGYVLASNIKVTSEGGGPRSLTTTQIDLRGRVGLTYVTQGMRTVGNAMTLPAQGQPDNYNLKTSAATVALGAQLLRPYDKHYVIGGEFTADIAKAVPGIQEADNTTTGITMYNLNMRAMFGKDFKKKSGMMGFGRLGFRFNSYQVSNVGNLMENSAKLPSEIIKAPTLGGALMFPKLTDKMGLRFSLDAVLLAASLQQTVGLEDGDKKSVRGANLGAGMTYKWKPKMDINVAYDLNYWKFDFGTPSGARGHVGTATGRTDVLHGVTVGVAYAL